MFCPNCGSENSNERRFCFNCGRAFLSRPASKNGDLPFARITLAGQETLEEILAMRAKELAEAGYAAPADQARIVAAPAETIFVLSPDEHVGPNAPENRDPPEFVFEDEEADDVFEQSLSGLRLDEAADEEEPSIAEPGEVSTIEPEPTIINNDIFLDSNAAAAIGSEADVDLIHEAIPATVRVRPIGWPLRIAGALLIAFLAFAAGVAATMYFLAAQFDIPNSADIRVAAVSRPAVDVPPTGMTLVPGGEFVMGSDDGDAFSRPAHPVKVEPFFIDITEVTNEAYLEFVKATGHDVPLGWGKGNFPSGEEKFPVTGVTWYDAAEYAAWRGKRLPTETEWEFAARGADGRRYPWGNEWDGSMANSASASAGIREVGQGGRSPFGALDMSGNVWEWTSNSARSFPNGKAIPWSRLKLKIIRGGSWQSDAKTATTFFRGFYGASGEKEYKSTGFRCVKDLAKNE